MKNTTKRFLCLLLALMMVCASALADIDAATPTDLLEEVHHHEADEDQAAPEILPEEVIEVIEELPPEDVEDTAADEQPAEAEPAFTAGYAKAKGELVVPVSKTGMAIVPYGTIAYVSAVVNDMASVWFENGGAAVNGAIAVSKLAPLDAEAAASIVENKAADAVCWNGKPLFHVEVLQRQDAEAEEATEEAAEEVTEEETEDESATVEDIILEDTSVDEVTEEEAVEDEAAEDEVSAAEAGDAEELEQIELEAEQMNQYFAGHYWHNDIEAVDTGDGLTHTWICNTCNVRSVYKHEVDCGSDRKTCGVCGGNVTRDYELEHHYSELTYVPLGNGRHDEVCGTCGEVIRTGWCSVYCDADDVTVCEYCGGKIDEDGIYHVYGEGYYVSIGNQQHYYMCGYCDRVQWTGSCRASCTGDNPSVCDNCGGAVDANHLAHGIRKYVSNGDETHNVVCEECDGVIEANVYCRAYCHNGNTDVCSDCGGAVSSEHILHIGYTKYVSNGNKTHQLVCGTCDGYISDEECWNYCEAEDTSVCYDCGGKSDTELNLSHNRSDFKYVSIGNNRHGYACTNCGYVDFTDRCMVLCDTEDKSVCDVCGGEVNGNVQVYHPYESAQYIAENNGTHEVYCEACDTTLRIESCSVLCDSDDLTVCEDCGGKITDPSLIRHPYYSRSYKDNGDGTHSEICRECGTLVRTDGHYAYCDFMKCECGSTDILPMSIYHDYRTYTDNGDGTHTTVCVGCGKEETSRHYVLCDGNGACYDCGVKLDPSVIERVHHWDLVTTDNHDGTHISRCLSCDYIEIEHHWAYCQNPNICIVCGANEQVGEDYLLHSYLPSVDMHDGTHAIRCSNCDEEMILDHYTLCDEKDKTVCYECGAKCTPKVEHHSRICIDNKDGKTHSFKCAGCDDVETENHVVFCDSPDLTHCIRCGGTGTMEYEHGLKFIIDARDNHDGTCSYACTHCGRQETRKHVMYKGVCQICGSTGDDPEPTPRTPGDANEDGKVDGRDAIRMERYLAGADIQLK